MSKINAIRLVNVNYNYDDNHISDEIFHFNGNNTLICLQNGGGKSVIVQLIMALFVQKRYRALNARPFASFFTSAKPTFIMVEWQLENNAGYCLTGMMVRKNQNSELNEDLEVVNFISEYKKQCERDLYHLPVVERGKGTINLKTFGFCKDIFDKLKKEELNKFFYYDMNNQSQSKQYFTKLLEYGIDYREWQNIIKKINEDESGLSKLFNECKDEKGLVERWFLEAVEKKLNGDTNRMQEYRSILEKYISNYSMHMHKYEQRSKLELFQQDAVPIREQAEAYRAAVASTDANLDRIVAYLVELQRLAALNEDTSSEKQKALEELEAEWLRLAYEEYSLQFYNLADDESVLDAEKIELQAKLKQLEKKKQELEKQLNVFTCIKLQERLDDDEQDLRQSEQKLDVCKRRNKKLEPERDYLGYILRQFKEKELRSKREQYAQNEAENERCKNCLEKTKKEQGAASERIKKLKGEEGRLQAWVNAYEEVENSYSQKWQETLSRNIMGEYELGFLELLVQKLATKKEEQLKNKQKMEQEQKMLKEALVKLERDMQDLERERSNKETQHSLFLKDKESLEKELDARRVLLQYLQLSEQYLFDKEYLLKQLDLKLAELDSRIVRQEREIETLNKQKMSLQTGKTLELAPELVKMLEDLDIRLVYGMEWLKHNQNTEQQNLQLVKQQPFLPYALIMSAKEMERLKQAEKSIYTSFPVPIVLRESLVKQGDEQAEGVVQCGSMHFYVLFNNNLLNESKLEKLLKSIDTKLQQLQANRNNWKQEYNLYVGKYKAIEQQEFTESSYNKLLQTIKDLEDSIEASRKRLLASKSNKTSLREREEALQKELRGLDATLQRLLQQQEDLQSLQLKYKQHLEYCSQLHDCEEELQRFDKFNNELLKALETLREEIENNKILLLGLDNELQKLQEEFSLYSSYKLAKAPKNFDVSLTSDMQRAQARLDAILKKSSGDLKNLDDNRKKIAARVDKSRRELQSTAKRLGLIEADWIGLRFNQVQQDKDDQELRVMAGEQKAVNERISQVANKLGALAERKKQVLQYLLHECQKHEPLPKSQLSQKNFAELKGQLLSTKKQAQDALRQLELQGQSLQRNINTLSEYNDYLPKSVWNSAINLAELSDTELQQCTRSLLREYKQSLEQKDKVHTKLIQALHELDTKADFQEEYYQKRIKLLQNNTEDAQAFSEQLDIILKAFGSLVAKLQTDLARVEKEKEHLVSMLEQYIKEVHEQLGCIDKNSSIKIRDKSVKMLKLTLPNWDENANVYHLKINDLVEAITRDGIARIQQNEPLQELLGSKLTTKNLYDYVVGTNKVRVQMFKIEAQREVAISWKEVALNSGGEGFLSAFVILSSLLYYMRRDETDVFADKNEGKVLIMDNPFAKTYSPHLLMPLMEMARKNNTQLISLSGLGGESIYNCYDNIYVLNLIPSKLSNGQYLKGKHILGNDVEIMELSRFEVGAEGQMETLF